MKYVIIIAVILAFSFIMGLVLGIVASDEDQQEQEKEDRDSAARRQFFREHGCADYIWRHEHKVPGCAFPCDRHHR